MTHDEIRHLAREVLASRTERLCEAGTTKKGRIIGVLVGEPTEAELRWEALLTEHLPTPSEGTHTHNERDSHT